MILLTSKDYYTLKSPRTREHECVRQGKFACVPYINMFPGALVCAILTVGNTECYLFILVTTHLRLTNSSHIGQGYLVCATPPTVLFRFF